MGRADIEIDTRPRRPTGTSLSTVVADAIRRQIAEGELAVGSRLAPEPKLAREYGISRGTLRDALKTLEREGLLSRRQRVGTTVSARPAVSHPLQRNGGVRDLIEASGRTHAVRDAEIRFIAAPPAVATALGLGDGDPVVALERTRTADQIPVVLTIDHIDAAIVERASAPLLPNVSFYEWLAEHCGIEVTYGIARLTAAVASGEIAERLAVTDGTPLLRLLQVDHSADGHPVLHSEELHIAGAFEVTVIRNGPFGGS
jgi:GntR family transcriptional regulator